MLIEEKRERERERDVKKNGETLESDKTREKVVYALGISRCTLSRNKVARSEKLEARDRWEALRLLSLIFLSSLHLF